MAAQTVDRAEIFWIVFQY